MEKVGHVIMEGSLSMPVALGGTPLESGLDKLPRTVGLAESGAGQRKIVESRHQCAGRLVQLPRQLQAAFEVRDRPFQLAFALFKYPGDIVSLGESLGIVRRFGSLEGLSSKLASLLGVAGMVGR